MASCKYITKEEIKKEREFVESFIKKVQDDFREKYSFSFNHYVVGSARRRLVVKRGNSPWDLDYQFKITSQKLKEIKKSKDLFEMKNDIKGWIDKHTKNNYIAKLSTSVVTLTKNNKKSNKLMSYDFAIVNKNNKVLKGKTEQNVQWKSVKKLPKAISRYKEINSTEKWDIFREKFLEKKCDNEGDDENKIPGYSIFAIVIKETLEKVGEW